MMMSRRVAGRGSGGFGAARWASYNAGHLLGSCRFFTSDFLGVFRWDGIGSILRERSDVTVTSRCGRLCERFRRERDRAMTERLPMEISVQDSDGVYFLAVSGRLTIGEPAEQLTEVLQNVVQRGGRRVVINLNGVPQIDSSGISSLVRGSIQLAREGGALHLVCGRGRVRDALTVTRLVEAIPTFDSDKTAVASFA